VGTTTAVTAEATSAVAIDRAANDAVGHRSTRLGIGAGVVVAATYWIGSSRAFGYDAAVTIANFVRTPSLLDPFRKQVVYNNHVALSFLEHLVYSATGSDSEQVMRVLPIAFAASCVGVLVAVVAARTTRWIAAVAGALLAANPMFVLNAREPRGYSLFCLCAVASTAVLLRLEHRTSPPLGAAYVGLVALGVATHLYMVLVLAGHIVFIAAKGRASLRWSALWLAGALAGSIAYAGLFAQMRSTDRGTRFLAGFPRELFASLTGQAALAVVVVSVGLAIGLWRIRSEKTTRALAALYLAVFAIFWLVLAPFDLYPRFFIWALPAVALGAASGLARIPARRATTVAVVLACLSMLWSVSGALTVDAFANRAVAPIIRAAQHRSERVCGLGTSTEALAVYSSNVAQVDTAGAMSQCDVLVALTPSADLDLVRAARERYATERRIADAHEPALVFSPPRTRPETDAS
jgi:hypothetical protein